MRVIVFEQFKFLCCILLASTLLVSGCSMFSGEEEEPAKYTAKPKEKEKVDPEAALKARVDAGLLNLQADDPQRALHHLNKALEWDDKSSDVYNAFALLYRYEGDTKKEEEQYKLALKYNKKDPKIHHNYGTFLCTQKRYDEGIKELQIAANNYLYEKRYQSFENLGMCALKKGDAELALYAFDRAYRINKKSAKTVLNLAELEFEVGSKQKSYRLFNEYMGLGRHTAKSLWLGIQLERVYGDKNALASYELALRKLFPGSKEYALYQNSLSK